MGWENEFTRIYRKHRTFVTRTLCSRGVRSHEVEDAIQEVYLTLFRRSPALESEFAVRAWLREVASNVALNRARTKRRREPHWSVDFPRVELDLLADEFAPSPERRTATRQQYVRVCGLIERLDSKRRSVLVLCYFEQLSAKDIAHRLGTRQSIVNSRLRLARAELKEAIRANRQLERAFDAHGRAPGPRLNQECSTGARIAAFSKP